MRQMSGIVLSHAWGRTRGMATDRIKLAGLWNRWADRRRRGVDWMRTGPLH